MNQISEITRRNIFDEMTLVKINWAGRFDEVHFLGRIFDLTSLPSTDHRFRDAGQDIWQHRINNYDWQDDWVFCDPRFNLLFCEDETFLKFLCETIHPVVRSDDEEVKRLVKLYNKHLNVDGFEIIEYVKISERPVFKGKEMNQAGKLLQKFKELNTANSDESDTNQTDTHITAEDKLRVFLCHANEDKTEARKLYARLKEDGFIPWLDEEDLMPGNDWDLEIRKAVRSTDVVLILLSYNSVTKAGYVQKEIRQAIDVADEQPEGTIFIIPVRLENCDAIDRLSHWQWVDIFSKNGYDRLFRALKKRESEKYQNRDSASQNILSQNSIPRSIRPNYDQIESEIKSYGAQLIRFQDRKVVVELKGKTITYHRPKRANRPVSNGLLKELEDFFKGAK